MTFQEYRDKTFGKDGKIHYVYWVTDTEDKTHYIGKHKCEKGANVTLDFFRYGTSSTKRPLILKHKWDRFVFTVLRTFDNAADAAIYESYLQIKFKVASNPLFWNRVEVDIPKGLRFAQSYHKVGVIVKETGEKTAVTSEEYQKNKDKYTHIASISVVCFDKELEKFVRVSKGEYQAGKDTKYVHPQKGKIPRFDYVLGANRQITRDEFEADPERYGPMKHDGRENIVVYDADGNVARISREIYHKNKDIYRTPSTGFVNAMVVSTGESIKLTREKFAELKLKGEVVGFAHYSKKDKVFDTKTQEIRQVTKEERAANPERYKYINSREAKDFLGRKHEKPKSIYSVFDTADNTFKKISKEEYQKDADRYLYSATPGYRKLLKESKSKKED